MKNFTTYSFILFLVFMTKLYAKETILQKKNQNAIKSEILALAESFKGQGDPDLSKQKQLEQLVEKLLKVSPQKPVAERLPLIQGSWKQVWGPYDYVSDKRGVDPSIDAENIYQVVFRDGYYYNVNTDPTKEKLSIGLLRGEYVLDSKQPNLLNVSFTKFDQAKGCPAKGLGFIDLPQKSEAGTLDNASWLIPSFVVRWFFGQGALREVYTDQDLRITFGSSRKDLEKNYIYVLKRIQNAPIKVCE